LRETIIKIKHQYYQILISFASLLIATNTCLAQDQQLQFLDESDSILIQIEEQFKGRLKLLKSEQIDKDEASLYEEIYENRLTQIRQALSSEFFFYDSLIYACINSIIQEISQYNDFIDQHNYTFLLKTSPKANAYSIGGGTIIINLGLLRKIRNQGELAFILSHEIAHDYNLDVDNTVYRNLKRLNSDEFKKTINKIDREKFNKKKKFDVFVENHYINEMKFSRSQETKADSLALRMLLAASYQPKVAINALQLLDFIDQYKFPDIDYENSFSFGEFNFKQRWISNETSMFALKSTEVSNNDSLKSHPDISQRVINLTSIANSLGDKTQNLHKKEQTNLLTNTNLDLAFIDSWINRNDYGCALFFSLKQLQVEQENTLLLSRIGELLDKVYEAQKSHELHKFVATPSNNQEASYTEFLTFLNRIRLSEFKKLIHKFHYRYAELMFNNQRFLARISKYEQ